MAKSNNRLADVLAAKVAPLLRDWLTVTWFRDTEPLGPLPRAAWNWIILAVWSLLTYLLAATVPLYLAGFAALTFGYSFVRSRRLLAARRAVQAKAIEVTRTHAGHPRSTTSQPVHPDTLVKVTRWGRKTLPLRLEITLSADSAPGHSPLAAGPLETVLDKQIPNPYTAQGGGWAYTHTGSRLRADAVTADDPRLHQQREIAFLRRKFGEWFKLTDKQLKTNHYDLTIADWATREHPQRGQVPVPVHIVFTYDSHSVPADFRDQLERRIDTEIQRPGQVWIYDWTTYGQLNITATEPDSVAAHRKLAQRWVTDLIAGKTRRSKEPATATVTRWQEQAHGDPAVPIAFTAELGSASLGGRAQRDFEDTLDEALTTTYPGLVWVYEWTISATTSLDAQAFPDGHIAALRKQETKRLRQVVDEKFGKRNAECSLEILEWEPCGDEAPTAFPHRIRVDFGTQDVSKIDTQDAFEAHFDSLFTYCDWNYSWRPDAGHVLLKAVEPLPMFLAFPVTGSPEFERFMELARQGKFLFGPKRRGGEVIWDTNQIPHALIGGQTGAGKSFALGLPLFAVLYQPDYLEAIVCDPKKMDFTWAVEFPNVVRFGAEDEEIAACIEYAAQQLEYRQQRCGRRGVRNLEQLRDLYLRHPEYEAEDGPCPKRMLLFFDEIADYLAKSKNKEVEEIKAAATALLEKLARLARALEINLLTAAQKPGGDIISTQLRSQLGFRMCVGPVDKDTSPQIILDNHGTMFPKEGNPKGRAWVYDPKDGYRMLQNMFLPNDTQPAPWDTSIEIEGLKPRVRNRLAFLGYVGVMVPNQYGGKEPRWVLTDEPAATAAPKPSATTADRTPISVAKPALPAVDQTPTLVSSATAAADSDGEWDSDWD